MFKASTQPKPEPRQRGKEKDGDEEFYAKIWAERPHICEESGEVLREYKKDSPKFTFQIRNHIAHCLPKSKYPQFRHNPKNILVLSFEAHQRMDNGDPRQWRQMKVWPKCQKIMMELLGEIPNEHKFPK